MRLPDIMIFLVIIALLTAVVWLTADEGWLMP